jgi:hypothetical protein
LPFPWPLVRFPAQPDTTLNDSLAEQLRQLGNIDGDPPHLIVGGQLLLLLGAGGNPQIYGGR